MNRLKPHKSAGWLCVIAASCVLAACAGSPGTPDPAAEATVSALSTSNAQLSTRVAELAGALGTPTPAPPGDSVQATAAPAGIPATRPVSATPRLPTPGAGPLPLLVADIALAPDGETLHDLRVDHVNQRIFVTDSADTLHVIDATTYAPIKTLPLGGWLELDEAHNRLYIYKPYPMEGEESLIHVLDTATLQEVGQLPGRAIAIDSANNRLFVGEPYQYSTTDAAPGVRIVDGVTLQQTGTFTQTGTPVYNPLRNELLIVAYTVYTADPGTQQLTYDLFPELTDFSGGGFAWCNGCIWANSARYYPAEQMVSFDLQPHCPQGCGTVQPQLFVDAATLQPIVPALAPEPQADCGSQQSIVGTVDGRHYHNALYSRYMTFTNLGIADEQGNPLTMRDGLRTDYINPRTNQAYLYDNTVIDLATLAPMGQWPAACLLADDPDAGLLYGRRDGSLYVIAERGAQPEPPSQPVAEALPSAQRISVLAVSPDFAVDSTLLAVANGAIYRSSDGAATWMRLAGGLPDDEQTKWTVAFSPDYAADNTIYAAGHRGEFWGDGVWRSQDGGETWTALWNNLQHRRIMNLYFAPDFAANQTLVAQAAYFDVANGVSGDSYQQSTDGGLTWTLVVTGNTYTSAGQIPLPPVSEVLPGFQTEPVLPVRLGGYGDSVEFALDGTNWQTATMQLGDQDNIFAVMPAPGYPDDPAIYAFGELSLWRTQDSGVTWEAWDDTRLADMDYTNAMSTGAVAPALPDGSYRLFVGTGDGQVWTIDPATAIWKPGAPVVAATVPTPATTPLPAEPAAVVGLPTPTPTQAPAAPTPVSEPLTGDPPGGLFRPEGSFASIWEGTPRIQQDLGWARQAGPGTTAGALQRFDGGTMIWRQDTGQIYAIFNDGTWQSFADTFKEGEPESDPKLVPPSGRQQPIRGFGKVWRDNTTVRDKLGWALAKEDGQSAQVQSFERGAMVRLGGTVFALIGVDTDRGKWY